MSESEYKKLEEGVVLIESKLFQMIDSLPLARHGNDDLVETMLYDLTIELQKVRLLAKKSIGRVDNR